ncbi:hypothetical protein AVEN_247700-1 [Araneus ventricosus]|uniref:Uncharacterized protein n=1 Tax=Araneus ventricosus TaxID=182803 RepID=A0A4Y2GMR2_ARAVE|nr:hypothetical protein AVEN_247700-1 [Araneus ventricosus]
MDGWIYFGFKKTSPGTRFPWGYSNGVALGPSTSDSTYILQEETGRARCLATRSPASVLETIATAVIHMTWMPRQVGGRLCSYDYHCLSLS